MPKTKKPTKRELDEGTTEQCETMMQCCAGNQISIPQRMQAVYAYCRAGGMDGLLVTDGKLRQFAAKLGNKYMDQVIPMANPTQVRPAACHRDHEGENMLEHAVYWESANTGSHGWCCDTCGTVVQWG